MALKNKKYSIHNFKGINIANTRFDKVSRRFKDGLLSVSHGSYSGYINESGKLTIPLIYKKMDCIKNICIVGNNEMNQIIDAKTGVKVSNEYDEIEGVALLGLLTKSNNKYGLLYYNGELILPAEYDEIRKNKSHFSYVDARKGDKWETFHKFRKMKNLD